MAAKRKRRKARKAPAKRTRVSVSGYTYQRKVRGYTRRAPRRKRRK